jgi:uncharacterized membrane protein YjdF
MEKRMRLIGAAGTVALVAFAVAAKSGSTYKIAPVFLIPLLWLPYFLRRKLHLHPLHYLLYALALFLHNFGALGYYQRGVFGLSFDIYVHFYFGVVGGLLVYRLLDQTLPLRPWPRAIGTVLIVLGAGAIHEEVEWFSTLLLGPERGMLKTPAQGVYIFDTQRDMFNNLIGAIVAVTLYAVVRRLRRPAAGRDVEVVQPERPAVAARV